jgi:regulator of ribosome biosynthesis
LPSKPLDVSGVLAVLPAGTTPIPREKPVPPEMKEKTKWEKFAEIKGIKKRTKSTFVRLFVRLFAGSLTVKNAWCTMI